MTAQYVWGDGTPIPMLFLCDGTIPNLKGIEDPEN